MAAFRGRGNKRASIRSTLRSSLHRPELIGEYQKLVQILLEEIGKSAKGDKIILTVYLLLPGKSSDQVLDAMENAAKRGAVVELTVDSTIASLLPRISWSSVLPRVARMAKKFPNVTSIRGKIPDHSKYAIFIPKDTFAQATAVWGGMNLGDQFQNWRDYAVRVRGPAAELLQIKVAGTAEGVVYPPAKPVNFVVNSRKRGYEELYKMFLAMMEDVSLVRLQIAMAYIDKHGAALLQFALDRGAEVDLLMPRKANVYHHCNMRTLNKRLIGQPGFRLWLHSDMVHAKALLAYDDEGIPKRSLMGSANLKKNSFGMLKELNSMIDDRKFNDNLAKEMDKLFEEAEEISTVPKYFAPLAWLEEVLG